LLDWRTEHGDEGRNLFQEEYAEWRVVRREDGKIVCFELTTELPEYWITLAGKEPQRMLSLLAEFAHEDAVAPADVYGELDPYAAGVSDAQRERAFSGWMLGPGASPYNNGLRAICCMRQPSNTLDALTQLVVAASGPHLVQDPISGLERCANAAELIPLLGGAAVAGRNSDPLLAERLSRLAYERRLISFDGPVGVFIHEVQLERLRQPDGTLVPAEWFTLGRNAGGGLGQARYQRLTFQAPPGSRFCVDDLVDVATGESISYGAQVAQLVQLAVFLRTSKPGVVDQRADAPASPSAPAAALVDCAAIRIEWERFESRPNG
jgi:hypothetical protein